MTIKSIYTKNRDKLESYTLGAILLLAIALRVVNLGNNPTGFFCDEASIGYNAYSIWHTGRDEYGKSWPLFFQSLGDYKNPVFIYSMAPIVGIFGLTELTVRLTSVIYGVGTIVLIYLLAKEMFGGRTGLWAALLLALSPWHILMSRVGFDIVAAGFWATVVVLFLYKSLKSFQYYPLALLAGTAYFFSYTTPKLYVVPIIGLFFLLHIKVTKNWLVKWQFWIYSGVVLGILFLLLWPSLADKTFFTRWKQVKTPDLSVNFVKQAYLNHFSIDFLFKKGDIDFPGQFITRHSIRGIGELYLIQLPLILIGLTSIFIKKTPLSKFRVAKIYLLLWLLIYPLGSVLTTKNPQATRSIIGVIPFQIITSVGLVEISRWLMKHFNFKYTGTVFLILLLLSGNQFLGLLKQYPQYSSDFWGWQYGAKPVMEYFVANQSNYDRMCLEGAFNAPEIFVKFYDPTNICQGKCQICGISDLKSDKIQLYAISENTYTNYLANKEDFITQKVILYPNGRTAFLIGELRSQ